MRFVGEYAIPYYPPKSPTARLIPAVEYIRAQRARTLLMREWDKFMNQWDVLVSPPGATLTPTNLTGHPCVVLQDGWTKKGTPASISIMGRLFDEGRLLAAARVLQEATTFHLRHPKIVQ